MWRGKRSFLSFFAQLYSYSSVAFVIFWILSLRPQLSGSEWAQRVPLGCFVAGTVGGGPSGLCWSDGVGCGGPTAYAESRSLRPMLSRFRYVAQRVPLSCFCTGTAGGWSHWAVLVSGVVGGGPTGLCWFDLPLLRRSESLGLTLS